MVGEEIWRFQGGADLATDIIYGAAAVSDGSFVVAGETFGSWAGLNQGDADLVVVKIDSEGKFLWAWQEGSSGEDEMKTVAALDDDSVVVAGYVNGTWNGEASLGLGDFAAIKIDSDGTTQWSWREGTEEEDIINTAVVTADGNIVLAGQTQGSWNGTQVGFYDAAAVKLDANGTVLWRWQEGADGTDGVYIYASTARPDGSVVLAGYTYGSWHGELSRDAYTDFVAVALDEDGAELWRWQDGGSDGYNRLYAATALADGSVVLAGYTQGDWSENSEGGKDFAAVKLDVDGEEEWRWQDGTDEDEQWETAASGTDGSIILAGYTEGSWEGNNEGEKDFAALSLDADGEVLWAYQEGTVLDDDVNVATVRADGAVLLAGWTTGSWHIADSDDYPDFAAILLDMGATATTSPPTTLEPATTPTPIPFFTSSPTAPVTTSSDAVPTGSPIVNGRGLPPTEPTPEPSQGLVMTLMPMRTAQPTNLVAPVQSSAPSSAPVVSSTSSSDSSTGLNQFIVGAVVGVAASIAVIGLCILRYRKVTGTVGSPAPDEDEHARCPEAVSTLPASSASASPPLPPPPYAEPPSYDAARRA